MKNRFVSFSIAKALKAFSIFVLLFAFAVAAFADQAEWVTKTQAEQAVKLLEGKKQIKNFCAPCNDESATTTDIKTVKFEKVKSDNKKDDYWQVLVNGESVDLAYIYFNEKKDDWKNVAVELDIEVQDVPTYLPKEIEGE